MMIFDHIGLFVADLTEGRKQLAALLPIDDFTKPVDDPKLKVRVQFGSDSSGIRYELVAPFGEGNPVSGVLDAGKNILNHVAYTVSSLNEEVDRLRDEGAIPLGSPAPAMAFAGARVIFLLTPLGFIIELIEAAD